MARIRAKIKLLTESGRAKLPLPVVLAQVNDTLQWWGRYFAQGYPAVPFSDIDNYVLVRLNCFTHNRSQRNMKVPEGETLYRWTQRLGLIRLAAPETVQRLQSLKPKTQIHG